MVEMIIKIVKMYEKHSTKLPYRELSFFLEVEDHSNY